jgi:hypothetical protein
LKRRAGAAGVVTQKAQTARATQPHAPALRFKKDSAEFTLENVDPRRPPLVIFRHPEKNLAARLEVRGDQEDPLTARLLPGGKLNGRVLDAAGEPLANARIDLLLGKKDGQLLQVQTFLAHVRADKEGRFTVEGVLPETGLMLLVGFSEKEGDLGRTIHSVDDLTVKAGEAKDLGDLKTQFKKKSAGNE